MHVARCAVQSAAQMLKSVRYGKTGSHETDDRLQRASLESGSADDLSTNPRKLARTVRL